MNKITGTILGILGIGIAMAAGGGLDTTPHEVDKDFSTCSSSTDCWARRGHSTSTLAGYATTILPNIDRDDWGFTSSSGTTSEDYTALQYSQIDTDDTDWATTSATEFGDSNIFIWRPIYNEYEIKVNRHPGLWANLNIETIGFLDPYATASATSTAAEDVYMYVYNAEEDEMEIVDSKLNGTCIGSATADCTLTFTTTTDIQDYFVATGTQWIIRYGVSMIDVGSDCVSYEGGNIICGKFKYGTTSVGTYQSIGCEPQTSSEDLHNQCPTTGCYKGNCNGAITPNPVGSLDPFYSCGVYADDLRNNCNVCEYCAAAPDASTSCALADTNFWEIEQYGCTGPCNSCENGACTDTKCEGSTCGCLDDELCISGVCTAQAPPNCPSTCAGLGYGSGFCAYDSYQCPVPPFFQDGTAGNCQAPGYCCCY